MPPHNTAGTAVAVGLSKAGVQTAVAVVAVAHTPAALG